MTHGMHAMVTEVEQHALPLRRITKHQARGLDHHLREIDFR
jgi:hypothetical protein